MRVLIACEYSGIVRDAFSLQGCDAWSCDLLPTESELTNREGKHIQGDVLSVINNGWDLMIAHPPCTYLAVAGNRSICNNPERWKKRFEALSFVYELLNANIPCICVENPVSVISSYIRKPDQIINPYYFGDNIPKKTCLWLKNLPLLVHSESNTLFYESTHVVPEYHLYNSKKTKTGTSRYSVLGKLGKGKGKERSLFFPGIAQAMAEQWTNYLLQ
jgi:hypothetical protein